MKISLTINRDHAHAVASREGAEALADFVRGTIASSGIEANVVVPMKTEGGWVVCVTYPTDSKIGTTPVVDAVYLRTPRLTL